MLGTGFCGALTTFSTLQLEVAELVRRDAALAVAYLAASAAAGLLLVALVTGLTRRAKLA